MPVVESLREMASRCGLTITFPAVVGTKLEAADCCVMVVMLSQNSTDSHNVVKEVMLASEQKEALLPVYLEGGHPESESLMVRTMLEDLANWMRVVKRHGKPTATTQPKNLAKPIAYHPPSGSSQFNWRIHL